MIARARGRGTVVALAALVALVAALDPAGGRGRLAHGQEAAPATSQAAPEAALSRQLARAASARRSSSFEVTARSPSWTRRSPVRTPAVAAGMHPGDRVVALDGRAIDQPMRLQNALAVLPAGTTVALKVVRDGAELTLEVVLTARRTP